MTMQATLTEHPAFAQAVRRYTFVLRLWYENNGIQQMARLFDISCRRYCDRQLEVSFHPFTWSGSSTVAEWTQAHADAAYEQAQKGG